MAFQVALEALNSTSHRDPSLHPLLTHTSEPISNSLVEFPWLLQKQDIPFLLAAGIPISGFGTTPHPHALHKVIETFLLFHHWSFLATTPSTMLFMKPSKFSKLQRINPNFTTLLNYRLTSHDAVRFSKTSAHFPSTESVFMHDALMYFHPSQILDLFEQCPNLNKLFCSLVVPPESDFTDLSLFPNLYTYTIQGQTLHYVPEGHHAGSYDQPLSALSWLKIYPLS